MSQLTNEERDFITEAYIKSGSFAEVKREFQKRFPGRQPPASSTIHRNYNKYMMHGNCINRYKSNSGRKRAARTAENIAKVRKALEENPWLSSRKNGIGLSTSTFNRIARLDLRWHQYYMRATVPLKRDDMPRRTQFSQWFLRQALEKEDFIKNIVIGSEATFSLTGEVRTHSVVEYTTDVSEPETNSVAEYSMRNINTQLKDLGSRSDGVSVWAGLTGSGFLLGPFFFDGTLTADQYFDMINEQLIPQMMEEFNSDFIGDDTAFPNLWWFQDGAPGHQSRNVMARLKQLFGERVVAVGHTNDWPPCSPDLNPCEFFLWGYLKEMIYSSPLDDVVSLRERIAVEFASVKSDTDLIKRVVRSLERRNVLCSEKSGKYVEKVYP